jgi:hypothetical protein
MQIVSSEVGLNEGIEQFLEELQKQNMEVSDSLLIIQTEPEKLQKNEVIIAAKIPETFSIASPLYKAKWTWDNVLIWEGADQEPWEFDSEKLKRFLDEHHLFTVGPVVEIFVNSSKLKREFWLPVRKEVGN